MSPPLLLLDVLLLARESTVSVTMREVDVCGIEVLPVVLDVLWLVSVLGMVDDNIALVLNVVLEIGRHSEHAHAPLADS